MTRGRTTQGRGCRTRGVAATLSLIVSLVAIRPAIGDAVHEAAGVESPESLYQTGCAAFRSGDYDAAGRALALLAPFGQADFGVPARYLLARCHHIGGEVGEALLGYEAVLGAFPADKPSPEYCARAALHAGALLAVQGRHADAIGRFRDALKRLALDSPLAAHARLHEAVSQVRTRRFSDALAALAPLHGHPQLGADARRWSARALIGKARWDISPEAARPTPAAGQRLVALPFIITAEMQAAHDRAAGEAVEHLRQAVAGGRADLLFELADAQSLAGRHAEAAASFAKVAADKSADLRELAMARQVAALQLCGQFAESDAMAARFLAEYPRSGLAGEVSGRHAENALYAGALDEAARRFEAVLAKEPEGAVAALARGGLAGVHYRRGELEKALSVVEQVAESQRVGELVSLSHLHADLLLRTLPPGEPDDALAMARMRQQADRAIGLLTGYAAAREGRPEAVEALVKLAHAYQRQAAVLDAGERRKSLSVAFRMHRLAQLQSPDHAVAVLEGSRIRSQLGDGRYAERELARFQSGALKDSPLAPVAMIHLGDALRLSRRPEAAAQLLAQVRDGHEAAMGADPARAAHVPVLRYALGLALKDSGRYVESRKVLDSVAVEFPGSAEAVEAAWRSAQCQRDIAAAALEAARRQSLAARAPLEIESARKAVASALDRVRGTADVLSRSAVELSERFPASSIPAHLHYDAALCWRAALDVESEAARRTTAGEAAGEHRPAESRLRESYLAVIESSTDTGLATDARIDLADLYLAGAEFDAALIVLKEGLEGEPPAEAADRLRLKLGAVYLQRNAASDATAAAEQFLAVAASPQNQYAAYARVPAGEALFLKRDYRSAAECLRPLLQRNAGPLTDRGLLRLAQSHVQLGQLDEARAALEALVSRSRSSPLAAEGRFGLAWLFQDAKDYDKAVAVYSDLLTRVGGELAARAQFQIGECHAARRNADVAAAAYLDVVANHNYTRWAAAALQRLAGLDAQGALRERAQKLAAETDVRAMKPDEAAAFLSERMALWTGGAATVAPEAPSPPRPPAPATRPAHRADAKRLEREARREQQRLAERRRLPAPAGGPAPIQITIPTAQRQRSGGQPLAPAVGHAPVADERGGATFAPLSLLPRPWGGAWLEDAVIIEKRPDVAAQLPAEALADLPKAAGE